MAWLACANGPDDLRVHVTGTDVYFDLRGVELRQMAYDGHNTSCRLLLWRVSKEHGGYDGVVAGIDMRELVKKYDKQTVVREMHLFEWPTGHEGTVITVYLSDPFFQALVAAAARAHRPTARPDATSFAESSDSFKRRLTENDKELFGYAVHARLTYEPPVWSDTKAVVEFFARFFAIAAAIRRHEVGAIASEHVHEMVQKGKPTPEIIELFSSMALAFQLVSVYTPDTKRDLFSMPIIDRKYGAWRGDCEDFASAWVRMMQDMRAILCLVCCACDAESVPKLKCDMATLWLQTTYALTPPDAVRLLAMLIISAQYHALHGRMRYAASKTAPRHMIGIAVCTAALPAVFNRTDVDLMASRDRGVLDHPDLAEHLTFEARIPSGFFDMCAFSRCIYPCIHGIHDIANLPGKHNEHRLDGANPMPWICEAIYGPRGFALKISSTVTAVNMTPAGRMTVPFMRAACASTIEPLILDVLRHEDTRITALPVPLMYPTIDADRITVLPASDSVYLKTHATTHLSRHKLDGLQILGTNHVVCS